MSLRLVRPHRLGFQPIRFHYTTRSIARFTTSNIPPNDKPLTPEASASPDASLKPEQETPVQKTLAATKAYMEKVQLDMQPRLEPYLLKINHASEQLKRLTHDVSDSKEALQRVSRALNELTGYDQIDAVKQKVNNQAQLFESTRDHVQEAKRNYEHAIETRSNTQRGINELLQRKHLWTGDDVTQFTELYRLEHAHSQAEMQAKEAYQACEKKMDREYMELARSIMERYHEEQLWSDKIRSVSTYGTWALMVVNLLLFVTVQTVFEPRKRKRLTDRFEELLVSKVDEEEEKFRQVFESLDQKDTLLMQQQIAVMETLNSLVEHPLFDQDTLQALKAKETRFPVPIVPVLPDEADEAGVADVADVAGVAGVTDVTDVTDLKTQHDDITSISIATDANATATESQPQLQPQPQPQTQTQPQLKAITTASAPSSDLQGHSEPTAITFIDTERNQVKLNNNEELYKLLLLTMNHVEETPIYKKEEEKESAATFNKRELVLYSIESALAGGLVTALAVYFFR